MNNKPTQRNSAIRNAVRPNLDFDHPAALNNPLPTPNQINEPSTTAADFCPLPGVKSRQPSPDLLRERAVLLKRLMEIDEIIKSHSVS